MMSVSLSVVKKRCDVICIHIRCIIPVAACVNKGVYLFAVKELYCSFNGFVAHSYGILGNGANDLTSADAILHGCGRVKTNKHNVADLANFSQSNVSPNT